MGDVHFSQGDGEISFCGAIEMSGFLDLKCSVIKGGMKLLPVVGPSPLSVNPIFEIGPLEPRYSEWLVFEGISVDEKGVQHYLGTFVCFAGSSASCKHLTHYLIPLCPDATIAYKRAVLNCIKYLANFGYTEEQVYLLLSCIPCKGRISGIVDVPNAVATLAIPLAVFDRDVRPPKTMDTLEQLANGIKILNINVCLSTEGGAVPSDPRLDFYS
jgi:formamidase